MAFQKGNKFWELRSKHGVDKLFKTPELMWESACEYFEWCINNPIKKQDFKGKDADEVWYELDRPFTMHGLCLYLGCSTSYFRVFKLNLKEKDNDFLTILIRIEETIYSQKFDGAAVGIFNQNIIARDLGLKEQSDITVNKIQIDFID